MLSLYVEGFYDVYFFTLKKGKEVSKKTEKKIKEKLIDGRYVLDMRNQRIVNADSLEVVYNCSTISNDELKYDWDN